MQKKLTSREQEVLDLLLKGLTAKEIAYSLNIKYATVDFHRNRLYHKLDVKGIQELFIKYGKSESEAEYLDHAEQENPDTVITADAAETIDVSLIKTKRKLKAPILITVLVISIFLNAYFIFSKISQTQAAPEMLHETEILPVVYATEEKPLIIPMKKHDPWGWLFLFHPPGFFDPKIIEGEIYTLHYSFSSNIDLDFLYIILADNLGTVPEPYYTQLSKKSFISYGNTVANIEYSGTVSLTAIKSASSEDHYANIIEFNTNKTPVHQPIITFTKFELEKTNSVSK